MAMGDTVAIPLHGGGVGQMIDSGFVDSSGSPVLTKGCFCGESRCTGRPVRTYYAATWRRPSYRSRYGFPAPTMIEGTEFGVIFGCGRSSRLGATFPEGSLT